MTAATQGEATICLRCLSNSIPTSRRCSTSRRDIAEAKGDFAEAEEQIGYAIDLNPTNVEYWGQLMRYQLADDRADDAIATYRRAGSISRFLTE